MQKIMILFGTRPEAIKLAPVIAAFQADKRFEVTIVSTGQHREMIRDILNLYHLKPDIDLDVMQKNQSLNGLFARIIEGVDQILVKEKPDWVLVHGDTTTAAASSVAAFHRTIRVGHVEAGLRTYDLSKPFPEEFNRQLIDKIAHVHFAPTELAKNCLLKENIDDASIHVTGNTVIDALLQTCQKLDSDKIWRNEIQAKLPIINPKRRIILVTAHRRESFGDGFERICLTLLRLVQDLPVSIIFPVHLNPQVQEPVQRLLSNKENIHLIQPVGYVEFIELMRLCDLVLTDSGGIQEEAPALGKFVLVMRDQTERQEAVKAGGVKLVGTLSDNIIYEVKKALDNQREIINPYGDGSASSQIVKIIAGLK